MNPNIIFWWANFWAAKAKRDGDNAEYWFQLGKAQAAREMMEDFCNVSKV